MKPLDRLDEVSKQLEFAIKLKLYVDEGNISLNIIDSMRVIPGEFGTVSYPPGGLSLHNTIRGFIHNNYIITLGTLIIALDTALEDASITRNPHGHSQQGQLRSVVYLLRCAFAHDMMTPKWRIEKRYKKIYHLRINNQFLDLDLTSMHGQLFDPKLIGGIETIIKMVDEVKAFI